MVLALLAIAALKGEGDSSGSSGNRGKALPAITAPAPPRASEQAAACNQVLAKMPLQIGSLNARPVHSTSVYVVAWGDPAVILACGVDKPKTLYPGSDERVFNAGSLSGPFYVVGRSGNANVYTIIDRAPYVAITVPAKYAAASILPTLVGAVGEALPKAVCTTDPNTADPDQLCTRRRS